MIRDLRESALGGRWGPLVLPGYRGRSFAEIPASILHLFGVETARPLLDEEALRPLRSRPFEHILLVLIDGLGFDTWVERAMKHDFFRLAAERGDVTSLTAVFPSTTSASLTTLATGLTPQEHGLPEWTIYLEEIDDIITTLPFKRWNDRYRDALVTEGIGESVLFEGGTIFEALGARGIESVSFTHHQYAGSAYSRLSRRGSRSVGFLNGSDLVLQIASELDGARSRSLLYVYWDMFDGLEHAYSPRTVAADIELENISRMLTDQLGRLADRRALERTLLIVTADHGQIEVFPERTIHVTDFPEVAAALRPGRGGQPILPTGGIRDVFLHVRPERLQAAKAFLAGVLAGKAEVLETEEAIRRGFFGIGEPSRRFRSRVGDLLLLPFPGESIWGRYPDARESRLRGHHGGLSPQEMFVPFAAAMLGDVLRDFS